MSEVKTNNQVEAILFKRMEDGQVLFLMLKRSDERGGFWQPITGNVRTEESFEQAAIREMGEETSIEHYLELIDTGYSFEFEDGGRKQFERVFGIEVDRDAIVVLSHEHTEFKWVAEETAQALLKYPGNKAGLDKLCRKLQI